MCVLVACAGLPAPAAEPPDEAAEATQEPAREPAREQAREPAREQARGPASEEARTQTGTVTRVLDGDTLEVRQGKRKVRVHVNGVDAPELRQPWGKQARAALEQLVLGQSVDFLAVGPGRRSANVTAVVFVGEAEVGAALVAGGNAWADRRAMRPSDAGLCDVEATARESRLGLWALPLAQRVAPWDYRSGFLHRTHGDYSQETAEHCRAVALNRPWPASRAPAPRAVR